METDTKITHASLAGQYRSTLVSDPTSGHSIVGLLFVSPEGWAYEFYLARGGVETRMPSLATAIREFNKIVHP